MKKTSLIFCLNFIIFYSVGFSQKSGYSAGMMNYVKKPKKEINKSEDISQEKMNDKKDLNKSQDIAKKDLDNKKPKSKKQSSKKDNSDEQIEEEVIEVIDATYDDMEVIEVGDQFSPGEDDYTPESDESSQIENSESNVFSEESTESPDNNYSRESFQSTESTKSTFAASELQSFSPLSVTPVNTKMLRYPIINIVLTDEDDETKPLTAVQAEVFIMEAEGNGRLSQLQYYFNGKIQILVERGFDYGIRIKKPGYQNIDFIVEGRYLKSSNEIDYKLQTSKVSY